MGKNMIRNVLKLIIWSMFMMESDKNDLNLFYFFLSSSSFFYALENLGHDSIF